MFLRPTLKLDLPDAEFLTMRFMYLSDAHKYRARAAQSSQAEKVYDTQAITNSLLL